MKDVRRYLKALLHLAQIQQAEGSREYADHCEAIMVGAVVAYSRPFVKSLTDGNADDRLNAEELGLFSDRPDFAALHTSIVERRNKVAAHSDWKYHWTKVVGYDSESGGITRKMSVPDQVGRVDPAAFLELAGWVLAACINRRLDLDSEAVAAHKALGSAKA